MHELAQADFVDCALYVITNNARRAEPNVGFDRSGKEEGILQHNSEVPAQILQIKKANIDSIQKDLPALDIVETQQQRNQGRLAGARVPDNCKCLTRRNPERYVAQHPIFVGGLRDVSIAEPHIAKLNFTARSGQTLRVRRGFNRHRLVEQLENSFAGRHCRLQNVEFLAQVLNRPEESLRVHRERGQHS